MDNKLLESFLDINHPFGRQGWDPQRQIELETMKHFKVELEALHWLLGMEYLFHIVVSNIQAQIQLQQQQQPNSSNVYTSFSIGKVCSYSFVNLLFRSGQYVQCHAHGNSNWFVDTSVVSVISRVVPSIDAVHLASSSSLPPAVAPAAVQRFRSRWKSPLRVALFPSGH
ncbi:hypothetical protein IV203_004687 [Nitzschia inconspicua]|uniref:Uncharacterized protein n=1 Tax=Nitzschia inconspicua TaxID=303405 RepID=A0A9K3PQB1_9STRA|nr:hypothetical protein IV203_004687 [Nitzschia inconspicua]